MERELQVHEQIFVAVEFVATQYIMKARPDGTVEQTYPTENRGTPTDCFVNMLSLAVLHVYPCLRKVTRAAHPQYRYLPTFPVQFSLMIHTPHTKEDSVSAFIPLFFCATAASPFFALTEMVHYLF